MEWDYLTYLLHIHMGSRCLEIFEHQLDNTCQKEKKKNNNNMTYVETSEDQIDGMAITTG